MTTTARTTTPTRQPMNSLRKTALASGVLYLLTFVTSIPALGLYDDVLNNPDFVLGAGSDSAVRWAAFLELFASSTATLFGLHDQVSSTALLGALPIAAWEFSLGVWLTFKGFTPSAITDEPARWATTDADAPVAHTHCRLAAKPRPRPFDGVPLAAVRRSGPHSRR